MPNPPSSVPQADVLLAGRYRLERLIGRGGMAEVWGGTDEVLQRDVAVKVLSTRFSDDEQFQRRFRREAQQAAALNHPNLVKVYDTGQHGDLPFIVMELVPGRSLQQVLARGGLTEDRSLEVCADVCAALEYAHQRGVIHRDVKPGNILLDDDGTVKVTDLGIARAIDSHTVTETANVLGTAAYLSPEQAQGVEVDARSDLYSLGVVLYEMLTGRQPFEGDSAVGVAYQHVQEQPVAPRRIDPSISPPAEAIAVKAMAKNPTNRYATAAEMRDDVLRARAGQTVSAPAVLSPDETAMLDAELIGNRPPRTALQHRRRRTVGYAILGLLTVLAFAGGIWLLASSLTGESTVLRTVPNVVNDTPADAQQALSAQGLSARFGPAEYSSDVDEGRVLAQDPGPGSRLEDGGTVTLTLSRGPRPVVIPNVAGMAEQDAVAALRNAELAIEGREERFDEEVEKGRVIGTDPAIGTSVPVNSSVTLIISAGEETEIVPRVVGLTEAEARFQLEAVDFEVLTYREPSDTVDEGKVIRQEPEGSSRAPKGSEVTIVISDGPQEPSSPTPDEDPSASPSPTPSGSETPSPIITFDPDGD
ncbi:MAG: Stk1 family PASTA domain-containing Ser/Thr kinase [Actinobacteria bacterium]|nr:Stk1 family PASTA domain-containing Ser/Thr kinase [Actinomycetota bacterium]